MGEVAVLQAQVNYAGRTSMEVGVRVEAEDVRTGARRYTTKAYLTFVAVDAIGKPRPIPRLVPVTDEDRRRHADAEARRAARLALRDRSR
jgi:acyl-CoA hydrolase